MNQAENCTLNWLGRQSCLGFPYEIMFEVIVPCRGFPSESPSFAVFYEGLKDILGLK